METSILLAKVFGLYLIAAAFAVLVNRKSFSKILRDFIGSLGLSMLAGMITFALGLLIVLNHNVWTGSWELVITILGWWVLIKGGFLFILPSKIPHVKFENKALLIVYFVGLLALGGYLTFVGFFMS